MKQALKAIQSNSKYSLTKTIGVLCLIAPALVVLNSSSLAQSTTDQDTTQPARKKPRYVETQYDPEPYYVDGVEYKPYVPDKPTKQTKPTKSVPSTIVPGYVLPQNTSAPQSDTRIQSTEPNVTNREPNIETIEAPKPIKKPQRDEAMSADSSGSKSAALPRKSTQGEAISNEKRPHYGQAIVRILDKVTAETIKFKAPIGQPLSYKGLIYTVRACETSAKDEQQPDVIAYLEVRTNPNTRVINPTPAKQIFRGWTYMSSPSLNPMRHAVYDALGDWM